MFAGNNAAGYMTTGGFITSYATGPDTTRPLGDTEVLLAVSGSALLWLITTYVAGALADRIGRRRSYIYGYAGLLIT